MVQREDIEGVKLHLVVLSTRMQGIENGIAINTEHRGLAIDDELLKPVLQCRFDGPRIPVGPVVAAAGDQAHLVDPRDVLFMASTHVEVPH